MIPNEKLPRDFFTRDVLTVAPDLLGKFFVCRAGEEFQRFKITETEAYRGYEDLACHASKGRTARTETMFHAGGILYVYLIYGMYWMLNIVTGQQDQPQAVLIRGLEVIYGPGRLTRRLQIDKSFNGEDITVSSRCWVENSSLETSFQTGKRIGVDYSGKWKDKEWRFYLVNK